jgi:catechol 2,3-dioxygenase-like lactoylglutathione lyase family enzyme
VDRQPRGDALVHLYQTTKERIVFSHVMVGANDIEASRKFYDAVLGTLGIGPGVANNDRYFYMSPTGGFAISLPIDGKPATYGNGSTIGFAVESPEQADAFHAAGIENGGTTCEDPPGFRDGKTYLAYLRDPAGNKICALHRGG